MKTCLLLWVLAGLMIAGGVTLGGYWLVMLPLAGLVITAARNVEQ